MLCYSIVSYIIFARLGRVEGPPGLRLDGQDLRRPCFIRWSTPDLPTNIVDFRGFDSSRILIQTGGIITSTGDFLESLSQAMLVGMLVGRLGVTIISTTYISTSRLKPDS